MTPNGAVSRRRSASSNLRHKRPQSRCANAHPSHVFKTPSCAVAPVTNRHRPPSWAASIITGGFEADKAKKGLKFALFRSGLAPKRPGMAGHINFWLIIVSQASSRKWRDRPCFLRRTPVFFGCRAAAHRRVVSLSRTVRNHRHRYHPRHSPPHSCHICKQVSDQSSLLVKFFEGTGTILREICSNQVQFIHIGMIRRPACRLRSLKAD